MLSSNWSVSKSRSFVWIICNDRQIRISGKKYRSCQFLIFSFFVFWRNESQNLRLLAFFESYYILRKGHCLFKKEIEWILEKRVSILKAILEWSTPCYTIFNFVPFLRERIRKRLDKIRLLEKQILELNFNGVFYWEILRSVTCFLRIGLRVTRIFNFNNVFYRENFVRFLPEKNRKTFCETIEAEKVSGIKFQSYALSRNFEIVSSSFSIERSWEVREERSKRGWFEPRYLRVIRNGERGELTRGRGTNRFGSRKNLFRFMLIDCRTAKQNRLRGVVVGLAMFTVGPVDIY